MTAVSICSLEPLIEHGAVSSSIIPGGGPQPASLWKGKQCCHLGQLVLHSDATYNQTRN
jgi:hypothetical protein